MVTAQSILTRTDLLPERGQIGFGLVQKRGNEDIVRSYFEHLSEEVHPQRNAPLNESPVGQDFISGISVRGMHRGGVSAS